MSNNPYEIHDDDLDDNAKKPPRSRGNNPGIGPILIGIAEIGPDGKARMHKRGHGPAEVEDALLEFLGGQSGGQDESSDVELFCSFSRFIEQTMKNLSLPALMLSMFVTLDEMTQGKALARTKLFGIEFRIRHLHKTVRDARRYSEDESSPLFNRIINGFLGDVTGSYTASLIQEYRDTCKDMDVIPDESLIESGTIDESNPVRQILNDLFSF